MVAINPPPPSKTPAPVWTTISKGENLLRIFDPNSFGALPTSFRHYGHLARFDHHRNSQQIDPVRGILYAGKTISCCLVEVFGNTRVVEVGTYELAQLVTTRELLILDLRGSGAIKAGTVAGVCKDSNRSFSQEWSRYFYENPFLYKEIDGLTFGNAHNDEDSFALYERASNGIANTKALKLSSPALRTEIQLSAAEYGLTVSPYKSFQ